MIIEDCTFEEAARAVKIVYDSAAWEHIEFGAMRTRFATQRSPSNVVTWWPKKNKLQVQGATTKELHDETRDIIFDMRGVPRRR